MLHIILFMIVALPQTDADRKVLEMADKIEAKVSQIREKAVKRPVEKGIYDKEQLEKFLLQEFDKDLPEDRLIGWQAALRIFGLIPEEMDLKQTLINFYLSQIGGFYNPETKKLYCMTSKIPFMQRIVMAHEITHALQDQYLDLKQYYDAVKLNDDLLTARTSVIEGEATYVMNLYPSRAANEMIEDMGEMKAVDMAGFMLEQFASLQSAPPYFMDTMTFPYYNGERFIKYALSRGGWKDVDALYLDPPESTEQIIHPEKYFGEKDEPQKITLPDPAVLAGEGFSRIFENTMGEYQVEILLKHTADPVRAMRAAPGWDGDTYHVLRHLASGAEFMVWALTFDSEKEAGQFSDAEAKALEKKYRSWGGGETDEGPYLSYKAANNRTALLEQRGTDVLVLDWVPEDLAILDRLREGAWKIEKGTFDFEAVRPVPVQ